MDTIHNPEASELMAALRPLAKKCRVKNGHWIATPKGEYWTNNGAEWCFDCGRAMVRHLRKKDRQNRSDYILDGGWRSEHDTTIHCCQCGVKLDCSLLSYGAIEELDYFRANPPTPGNVDEAYEISEMLSAFEYVKPEHAELAQEAIEIARKLVSAMGIAVGDGSLNIGGRCHNDATHAPE